MYWWCEECVHMHDVMVTAPASISSTSGVNRIPYPINHHFAEILRASRVLRVLLRRASILPCSGWHGYMLSRAARRAVNGLRATATPRGAPQQTRYYAGTSRTLETVYRALLVAVVTPCL